MALPRLRWPSGLRSRVLLLIAIAVLPPIVLLVAGGLQRRSDSATAIRDDTLDYARLAAQAQQRRLEGARQFLIALSRAADVRGGNLDACRRYVRSLAHDHRDTYDDIGLTNLDGEVVCHALETADPLFIADRPYFQRALATGRFTVGEYMVGRVTGIPRLAFSYPLRADDGRITGVLSASIDLMRLSAALETEALPHEGTLAVLDRNGRILARSVDATRSIGVQATKDQVQLMASRGELTTEFRGPDGTMKVYGVTTIRDVDGAPALFVTAGLRRDLAMAAADRQLALEIAALLALGCFSALVAWHGAERLIRRPIAQLADATKVLASGQLETRVSDPSGVKEVVDLSGAFNTMAERLQQRDLHLRRGQRMEAVGQLAGGIAHDFNNLLTVIVGYGDALRRRVPPGTDGAMELDELLAAADRAATLTRQLLAFSKQQTLQPRPIHLNEVIAHLHSMLTRVIGEDIKLAMALGADLGIVKADPTQLEQVVMNLVVNARDAMPSGGTLTIETFNSLVSEDGPEQESDFGPMAPGHYAVIRVSDTGSGMDEPTRARIFEPFFSTKGSMGTGLGLATVYGIVEQSEGFIWCESEVGRGTRFSIYLPLTSEPLAPHVPAVMAPSGGGHERIIVVEDEDAVRTLVVSMLSRRGYDVRGTARGAEALEWLRGGVAPDLLVVDMIMPEINGVALYEAARRLNPSLRVLFMSGYAEDARHGARMPDDAGFLQKPFAPADLLKKVRDVLDAPVVARR